MAKFKIGDRFVSRENFALWRGHLNHPSGSVGTVVGIGLPHGIGPCPAQWGQGYTVEWERPRTEWHYCHENFMEPLPKLRDDLEITRWADCPWQPHREHA